MHLLSTTDGEEAGMKEPLSRQGEATPLRSYTQADLDAAIRDYKARRAPRCRELVEAVHSGKKGAIKCAQELFGRNAIARALGVKARAMVSKSEAWLEIARELQLPHKNAKQGGLNRQRRIGLEIADERKAQVSSQTVLSEVIRNETIAIVRKALPQDLAESVIQKLEAGEIDDDGARQMIELAQAQQKDDRTRKIRQAH
jgi:hypothetical protein